MTLVITGGNVPKQSPENLISGKRANGTTVPVFPHIVTSVRLQLLMEISADGSAHTLGLPAVELAASHCHQNELADLKLTLQSCVLTGVRAYMGPCQVSIMFEWAISLLTYNQSHLKNVKHPCMCVCVCSHLGQAFISVT